MGAMAEVEKLREALDDLWGCIGVNEIKDLQPETVRVASENHTRLNHSGMSRAGRFLCRTMGWHKRPYEIVGFDGASTQALCRRCGKLGLVDSQGNLF